MESIKEIFKIGKGPSSSHTMGPLIASHIFAKRNVSAARFEVTLYGSLAATGKGHQTDEAILEGLTLVASTEIHWEPKTVLPFHPNGMKFVSFNHKEVQMEEWVVYSIGGGAIAEEGQEAIKSKVVYPLSTIESIQEWCRKTGRSYWEFVETFEGPEIWDYLAEVWTVMKAAVERGLDAEGVLPGGLNLRRKASDYMIRAQGYNDSLKSKGMIYAYALAVSEENAAGGIVSTAPTCGSCGVLPAVLYHCAKSRNFSHIKILRALATAGIFGAVVRQNASVSGALVGCQGEVGVACAMASAAACQLFGGTIAQIEYAAEMGLEHHLGLTCDPVCGLVQIPCIERNAFAAARAFDCNVFSSFSDGKHRVTFDKVVEVMKQTGQDLPSLYKETSEGGLAANFNHEIH